MIRISKAWHAVADEANVGFVFHTICEQRHGNGFVDLVHLDDYNACVNCGRIISERIKQKIRFLFGL